MSFCVNHEIAFVHIPRTAGVSIQRALWPMDHAGYHMTARELRAVDPERWNDCFKFAVVRNPWDRIISLYHFHREHSRNEYEGLALHYDFVSWLEMIIQNRALGSWVCHGKDWTQFIFGNQRQWLADDDGRIIVDEVLDFGKLPGRWDVMRLRYGLPPLERRNASKHDHYMEYYSDRALQLVAPIVKPDVEEFGYVYGE